MKMSIGNNSKPVFLLGRHFGSMSEASNETGITISAISRAARENRLHALRPGRIGRNARPRQIYLHLVFCGSLDVAMADWHSSGHLRVLNTRRLLGETHDGRVVRFVPARGALRHIDGVIAESYSVHPHPRVDADDMTAIASYTLVHRIPCNTTFPK